MPKISPFAAYRYNLQKVNPSEVVAPPYDVIGPEQQDALYKKSPYNVVRIDLAKEEAGLDRYQIAKKNFEEWKQKEILVQDSKPSLYLYFQTFALPDGRRLTRKGFLARRRLESFAEGGVKPHEMTFPGPKADRLQLMQATKANLSPIFGLYSDPKSEVSQLLLKLAAQKPDIHIVEANGDEHQVWRIDSEEAIRDLLNLVHDRSLLIADGHHRYETALAYRDEQLAKLGALATGKEAFNYVMMYFCSLQDEGLVVLPTHRVLEEAPELDAAMIKQLLEKYARIKTFTVAQAESALEFLEAEGKHEHAIAWVHEGKIEVMTFDVEKLLGNTELSHLHFALRDLDVTILHHLVLEEIMGISRGAQKEYGRVHYIKNAQEAIELVQQKKSHAFLMNATKLKQIEAVTEIGEKMPQKSTFFYPKLLTGLVFCDLSA